MAKNQPQQDNSKQSEYARLKTEIEAYDSRLSKLKKQRDFLIGEDDYGGLVSIVTVITQLEKEKRELEMQRQKMAGLEPDGPQGMGDNQIILSTSVVRRKDSIALKEVERPKPEHQ